MLRKVSLVFLGLLVILLTAVFLIPSQSYVAFIEQKIIKLANENELKIALASPALSGLGVRADRAELAFPKALVALEIEDFGLNVAPLSLLSFKPRLRIKGAPYGGTLLGNLTVINGGGKAAFHLGDVNIASHPQISGLGIERGRFTMQNVELSYTEDDLDSFKSEVLLSDVQKPAKTVLRAGSFGLPLNIELPGFSNLEAMANVIFEEDRVQVGDLRLSSSLLRMMGNLNLQFDRKQNLITGFDLHGEVELSEEGSTIIGMYLPLISEGSLQANSRHFTFSVEGDGSSWLSKFRVL